MQLFKMPGAQPSFQALVFIVAGDFQGQPMALVQVPPHFAAGKDGLEWENIFKMLF